MKRLDIDIHYLMLAIAIVLADRLTKIAALSYFDSPLRITEFLNFELAINRGVSWGMFHSARTDIFFIVTMIILAIIVSLFCYTTIAYLNKQLVYGEVAVLAGACSNLVDRYVYGGVIDFIHFSYQGWSWPIFNIADIAIVLGVAWIFFNYKDS
jgi:signal peptidase II